MTETWKVSTGLLAQGQAETLASEIEQRAGEEGIVVAAFETEPDAGTWRVEAYVGEQEPTLAEAARLFAGADVKIEKLPEIDWVSRSQSQLSPIRTGRFFVHGEHDRHRRPPGSVCIEIQAGQAFGTGHHGTTQGCLLAIDHVLRKRRPEGVLDLGCGSAVLAIAVALSAKRKVLATDIDPIAITTSTENAELNGAAALLEPFVAPGMRHRRLCEPGQFDLVIANILASPLQAMKKEIAQALGTGGELILSGITVDQEPRLLGSYRPFGLTLRRRWRLDGWSTLLLRRKSY